MTDYYEKNMKLLKKHRPAFYEKYIDWIEEKTESIYPCEQIQTSESRDGHVIFSITRNGETVRLNSLYRPLAEAERWAKQFSFQNLKTTIAFFGMGNLMFADSLLKNLQSDGKLFLYEPCTEILTMALQHIDMGCFIQDKRVFFFLEDINASEFGDHIAKYTHWTNIQSQVVCHHTGYDQVFPEAYQAFQQIIEKKHYVLKVNKNTEIYFSKKIVTNSLRNLHYIQESRIVTDYVGKIPQDIPAIIVAAGPSLDKNIEELKKAKGKAFIIGVDTAIRHLVKHGILPDAMVTVDAGKPTNYINDPIVKDIPLFCALMANPEIMEFHKGLKIWFKAGAFLMSIYERYGKEFPEYNPGGSVATAAFSICCTLQFERIILVGQDLAYQGEITHAGGEVSSILHEESGIRILEGIDGKPVKSRHDWAFYLEWLEDGIRDVQDKTEVIDATEGGAMIHGTRIMTLKDAIQKYCIKEVDIAGIIQQQPPTYTEQEYAKLKKEFIGYLEELRITKNTAKTAQRSCEEAIEILKTNPQSIRMNKLQKNISSANKRIEKQNIYILMDIYITQVSTQYLSDVFLISDDNHQDELNMYQNAQMVYKGIYDATQDLYPEFEQMVKRIKCNEPA